jgi:hypothetical protein
MNRTLTLTLAIAAGLVGGLLARYVPPSLHAQPQALHVDVRWQAFTLIDAQGHVSQVVLRDPAGVRFRLRAALNSHR